MVEVRSKLELLLKFADVGSRTKFAKATFWRNFTPGGTYETSSTEDSRSIVTPWLSTVGHSIVMQSTTSPSSGTAKNTSSASKENGFLPQTTTNPTLTPSFEPVRLALLALYPFTVFLGFLSNHPPDSYFARKDNFINVLFLKFAWGWTSLAFIAHATRVPQKIGPTARYAVATIWWYLVTQWCFGPPIMDKVDLRSS